MKQSGKHSFFHQKPMHHSVQNLQESLKYLPSAAIQANKSDMINLLKVCTRNSFTAESAKT